MHDIIVVPEVVVLDNVRLVGLNVHVADGVVGEVVADSEIVPVNPCSPLTVTVVDAV